MTQFMYKKFQLTWSSHFRAESKYVPPRAHFYKLIFKETKPRSM